MGIENISSEKQAISSCFPYASNTVQVEDIRPKIRAYNAPACQTRTRLSASMTRAWDTRRKQIH